MTSTLVARSNVLRHEVTCKVRSRESLHIERYVDPVSVSAQRHTAPLSLNVVRVDTTYRLYQAGAGFHMADGEYVATNGQQGHRTRTYINPESARRALDRGELYTQAEYIEATTVNHLRKRP